MILYYWLKNIFNILLPVTLIIFFLTGMKEKKVTEKADIENFSNNNELEWQNRIKILLEVFSNVIMIGLILFTWIKLRVYWIFWAFCISVYIKHLVNFYLSIGIVGNVVKSNSKDKLTVQELAAIEALAYVLWLIGLYDGFEWVIGKATEFSNVIVSDLLLIVLHIAIVFMYAFLICALLPVSLSFCLNILKWVDKYIPGKEKLQKCENIFIKKIEAPFEIKSWLIILIDFIRNKSGLKKYIWYVLIPFVFVIDIIKFIVLAICSMVFSTIGYVLFLCRLIKKTVKHILNYILSLSDKRIVSVSFRIAFIIALTCTVVLNRYQPFLKLQDTSTAVLEFVASSIIIPVVFEWIYSFKNRMYS